MHMSRTAFVMPLPVNIWKVPIDTQFDGAARGRQAPLFASAFALSALAWRAA